MSCCGKFVCSGCAFAVKLTLGIDSCPLCRTLTATIQEDANKQMKSRVDVNDAQAIYNLACDTFNGDYGVPQDRDNALTLWRRAAELGCSAAHYNIGNAYRNGEIIEKDMKKAKQHYELGAMGGDVNARYNLAILENDSGNVDRAIKHLMIAVGFGSNDSLKVIKHMYAHGYATKDEYTKALQSYQSYLDEIKSDDRDMAAAFSTDNRYYE